MADQPNGEVVAQGSGGPVPELVSAYQRARVQVVVTAALLLLWRAGIEFEGPLPLLGIKVAASEKLAYLLGAVLTYGVVRLVIEWFQSHPARRRRLASRIDMALTLGIAGMAAQLSAPSLFAWVSFPPLWLIIPMGFLVVLSLIVGAVSSTLLDSFFFVRSKEEASRLGLPRYPVAVRAMIRMWCYVMLLVVVVVVLSPGFAGPLYHLWGWLLGIPAGVLLLSEGIALLFPWRRLPDGKRIPRAEYISGLRRVFDEHDTYYQLGGWDRRIASNNSPLYIAAETGDSEHVRELLDRGARPNQLNKHGWTPLMIAVAQRHDVIAILLLRRGADPNVANFIGRTPLMFAARYGLVDLVRELITFGADVNLNRSPDPGPLAIAAEQGHADVVRLLLEASADVSRRDRGGHTALDLAQASGHGEIAAVLRKRMQQSTDS